MWHLELHDLDISGCDPHDFTTDVDEDLNPGEFHISKGLRRAKLDADVTLQFGCCDGGTAPAHISIVWSKAGHVTKTVGTSTQGGQRTRTVTKTRPSTITFVTSSEYQWPLNNPPSGYLQSQRTTTRD